MALTQSGRMDFVLSYPGPGTGTNVSNTFVLARTNAPTIVVANVFFDNFSVAAPPWETQAGLTISQLNDDGTTGSTIYQHFSYIPLSISAGSHSLSLDIVDGDIQIAIDDWQMDLSAGDAAPRNGTPFVSYSITDGAMLNGTLTGNGFGAYPYPILGVGEEVPMICGWPAPGSLDFSPSTDNGVLDYHPNNNANAMGLLPIRFVGSGGAFWTNRYLATES